MKRFKDIQRLNEAASGKGKIDPEGYYAVYKSGGKLKVAGPYATEAEATDYNYDGLVDVLDGAELVRSEYRGIRVVKEEVEVSEQFKAGDRVKVPHKGKMVSGKIVRFDDGGKGKAQQHGGGYVVDVGEPASILVPSQKVQKESVGLGEAAGNDQKPGKPETMAQKHGRMQPRGFKKRGEWVVYCREVLKDWKSGDMALNRLEMVMSDLQSIGYGIRSFDTRGMTEPFDPKYIDAVGTAFRKSIGKGERVGRLGKGGGFNPSMGKVTPNEITAYLTAVLDFCENGWADLDKQYGVK